jgi:hypothetical protein
MEPIQNKIQVRKLGTLTTLQYVEQVMVFSDELNSTSPTSEMIHLGLRSRHCIAVLSPAGVEVSSLYGSVSSGG